MSKQYQRKKQILKDAIERIIAKHGHCTPDLLVKEAAKKSSPIHRFFDWNEKTAAAKWRLEQASYYLRTIEVVVDSPNGGKVKTRAFVHLNLSAAEMESDEPDMEKGRAGVYASIETVMADPDSMEHVLDTARRELEAFERKYSVYRELTGIVKQVRKVIARIGKA